MSDDTKKSPVMGSMGWLDLTIEDATAVRDFYAGVVGLTAEGLSMGDYEDFVMKDASGTPVGGVCHARGSNAVMPPVWLPYFHVADVEAALVEVEARGGTIVKRPAGAGGGRFAVFQDPAGAYAALYQA